MSASVANGLPNASEWLQGDAKSLGHILWTGRVTGLGTTVGRLQTAILTVQILHPVMSICLEPLRSTLLVCDMQQTVMWSKLSPPGCRHLILGFAKRTLNSHFWLHDGVMCTVYWYCCATYTVRCEYSSWHSRVAVPVRTHLYLLRAMSAGLFGPAAHKHHRHWDLAVIKSPFSAVLDSRTQLAVLQLVAGFKFHCLWML